MGFFNWLFSWFSQTTAKRIAEKPGDHTLIDLKLDGRLKPASAWMFELLGRRPVSSVRLASTLVPGQTYAIGSTETDARIYRHQGDLGLFGCVLEAWKNHWILRTSPEDWWFSVTCLIAKQIEDAAKSSERRSEQVREFFVHHKGKENIVVELDVNTIYEADYEQVFTAFSSQIDARIKVPDYAQAMQNDFSTSNSVHAISSQVNLMASMQEFFEYKLALMGCGLRGLEMKGSVADWEVLTVKFERLREILKPLQSNFVIRLHDQWFDHVLHVFHHLALTRRAPEDPEVAKFWINILMDTTGHKWVGGGGSGMGGKNVEVKAYDGWLVSFLTDYQKVLAEELSVASTKENGWTRKSLSGCNQVPMEVSLTSEQTPVSDTSTLVAGIAGFKLHKGGSSDGEAVPSVEPHHMWAMLLPPDSPLRGTKHRLWAMILPDSPDRGTQPEIV